MIFEQKKIALRTFSKYFLAFCLSLLAFTLITQNPFPLNIPYDYWGDALFSQSWVKSIVDNGWYLSNAYLGAPNGYIMTDFPMSDNFHFFIMKILSLFTSDYAVVLNTFYLLTYPSITLTALFVLQRLGVIYPLALTASLLFALMPFHFLRSEKHLLLSSYYIVPLAIWLAILVGSGKIAFTTPTKKYLSWSGYLLLCLLIGSSGVYYAFFSVFFIFIGGLIGSVTKNNWRVFATSILLITIITLTVVLNVLPTLIYNAKYGKNESVGHRHAVQAEYFGFKITPLLLPITGDRIKSLASFRKDYDTTTIASDNMLGSGIIVSLGFLILIGTLLFRKNTATEDEQNLTLISKLNISGILLGTIGGFGTLFAYAVSPMIRCYERISIYIIFFSLFAFFWLVQKTIYRFFPHSKTSFLWLLSLTLLAVGIFSQTSSTYSYKQLRPTLIESFKNDKQFVHNIEKILPPNSMIFQLPYNAFPESGLDDYEHFRPYLHSHHLKWSYGASQSRSVDQWQREISQLSTANMLDNLAYAGYTGIYINRSSYADKGVKIETELTKLTKETPLVSHNHGFSFFSLRNYVAQLQKSESSALWNKHVAFTQEKLDISLVASNKCYPTETVNNEKFQWCQNTGNFTITNYSSKTVRVKLTFKVRAGHTGSSTLKLKSPAFERTIQTNKVDSAFSEEFTIKPGKYLIKFNSNARRSYSLQDPRKLYFILKDFHLEPLGLTNTLTG